MNSLDLKKLIDIHVKVLNSPLYSFTSNDSNYLQLVKGDAGVLNLVSVGDLHKVILNVEDLNNVGLDDFTAINPIKLSKTLPFFEDDVSCFVEDGVLDFRNNLNTRNVKLHNLFMVDDFKVSLDEINSLREDLDSDGVQVNLKDFRNVLNKLKSVGSVEDDEDLKNVVDINFMKDGTVFTGSSTSVFKTMFNLGLDTDLVIDKATSLLLLDVLGKHDESDVFKIKVGDNKVSYLIGDDIVVVDEWLEAVNNVDAIENEDYEGSVKLSSMDLHNALSFSITVGEEDDADVELNDNVLTVKTYVANDTDDSSKVDLELVDVDSEDFKISMSLVKQTVLPILKQMESEVELSLSYDGEVIMLEDGLNKAYVGVTIL